MKKNVITVELLMEIHDMVKYKVVYEESDSFEVTVIGRTCNYNEDEIKNIPESVLDFVDKWLTGNL